MNTKSINFICFVVLLFISGVSSISKTHFRSNAQTSQFVSNKFYKITSEKFNWSAFVNAANGQIGNKPFEDKDIFKWSITATGDGTWFITSKSNPNLVWDLTGSQSGESVAILNHDKHGGDNQRWTITKIGENKFTIASKLTQKCARPGTKGHWNWQFTCSNQIIDNWIIEEYVEAPIAVSGNFNSVKVYKIKSEQFNWFAYVKSVNGQISQKVWENSDTFKWSIVPAGDGSWFITSKSNPNLVWDLKESNPGENVPILSNAKHGGDNQRFFINKIGENRYTITSKLTGKCARPGPYGGWNFQLTCSNKVIDNWIIEEDGLSFVPHILNLNLNANYILRSKKFNWCANTINSGSNVSNKVCSSAANFQWNFVKNDDNTYFIKSFSHPNLIWDVAGSNMAESTAVLTNPQNGGNNQRFYLKTDNGTDFMIINKLTQKCARPGPQGHWDWSFSCTGADIDFWGIERLALPFLNANIHIINKWNGQCISSNGGNQQLRFGNCLRNNNFYWNIEQNGGNLFIKSAVNLDQVFDITGSGVANGVKALNWGRHGANNQRWLINMKTDNFYEIRNVNSNRCLQLQDNLEIVQWDCNDNARQLFQIVAPGSNLYPISGRLIDGVTGQGFTSQTLIDSEANITFNNTSTSTVYNGNINYETSTYSANLPDGTYRVVFSMENHVTVEYEITITGSSITTTIVKDLVISQVVRGMRATLVWGAKPKDLDLYIQDAAGNRIFWNNKSNGAVALDVDDRDKFGPETITIKDGTGDYKVYVRNYSKEAQLSESEGVVTINVGEEQVAVVKCPTTQAAADNYVWNIGTYNAQTAKFTVTNAIQKTI